MIGWDLGEKDRASFAVAERQPDGPITFREFGVVKLSITMENGISRLPLMPEARSIELGRREISGSFACSPNTLIMGRRVYLRLARRVMPKRKWRRMRGRMKGEARLWRAQEATRMNARNNARYGDARS